MKITSIKIKNYLMPLDPPFKAAWDPSPRRKFGASIVCVNTDEGITGIGSGDAMMGLKGHEHLFIGRDPYEIERHWQVLDNIDFHYGRCWPVDVALWDIMGKARHQPIAKLLNAKKSKILAYASTGEIMAPEDRAQRAQMLWEQGFKAIKIRFHQKDPREDIKVVEAVREVVGDQLEIMVDANQGWKMPWDTETPWDFEQAYRVAKELEQLNAYWLEEPLPHYDFRGLARLREKTEIRIAGGEMNRRWHDFQEMNNLGSLDVYQPDAVLAGGITMVKKIAEWVQDAGAWYSPHTWSNGIGLVANLHLACALSKCPYLEFPFDPPAWTTERRDYMLHPDDRLMIDGNGYLHVPQKPGLGCELDQEALSRYEVNTVYIGEQ
ncbi:MAG: mandelate racemase/muconate lactonizing enzyme family protein [Desulfobacterales bacterium]